MFSGLVQDLGEVESVELGPDGARIRVSTALADQIGLGDSVAVNGCLPHRDRVSTGPVSPRKRCSRPST